MFAKGNKYGKGRPKISLNKPELLLPIIFQKSNINWAEDFARLYKASKVRELTKVEYNQYRTLQEMLPYLCTKVSVKDLDFSKWHDEKDKQVMTEQTNALIKALENGSIDPNKASGVEGGGSSIPPTA